MPHPPEAETPTRDPHPLRHRVEVQLVRGILLVARLLPSRVGALLADAIGTLMRLVLPRRARIAREQMAAAFKRDPGDAEIVAWTRAAFRHFIRIPLELVKAPGLVKRGKLHELVIEKDRHQLDAVLAKGRGAILLTGHFGNWELFGLVTPLLGLKTLAVARPMKNRRLDAELQKLRSRYGQQVVEKDGAGIALARHVRRGGIAGLLNDQHAGSRGLRVPFFHADASTFTLAAALTKRFGTPIVPWFSRVLGLHRVEFRYEAPIEADPTLPEEEDVYRMTCLFHRRLEAAIRADPGQYLWFHRRWKAGGHEPEPAWRERYARDPK